MSNVPVPPPKRHPRTKGVSQKLPCRDRARYKTAASAEQAKLRRRAGVVRLVEECEHCHGWHVTVR